MLSGCDNQPTQSDNSVEEYNISRNILPQTERIPTDQPTDILELRYIEQSANNQSADNPFADNPSADNPLADNPLPEHIVADAIEDEPISVSSAFIDYDEFLSVDDLPEYLDEGAGEMADEMAGDDADDDAGEGADKELGAVAFLPSPVTKNSTLLRKRYKQKFHPLDRVIAIVIDDVGIDQQHSRQATQLHGVYTLSFLTYGENLKQLTQMAMRNGHEIFLHQGAEPIAKLDPGPDALTVGMDAVTIKQIINSSLKKIPMAVGLNNHMGSKFAQWQDGMNILVEETYRNDLIFLDSFTHKFSQGLYLAQQNNYPALARDVFIDGKKDSAWIKQQLKITEEIALKDGFAIAIGHPRQQTMQILPQWQEDLKAQGFTFVTISQLWQKLQRKTIQPETVQPETPQPQPPQPETIQPQTFEVPTISLKHGNHGR